jgi:hypothetical protein
LASVMLLVALRLLRLSSTTVQQKPLHGIVWVILGIFRSSALYV